jgi:hypothetical protein
MGSSIPRTAGSKRIHETGKKALTAAQARGGDVKAAAEARLGPAVAAMDDNEAQLVKAEAVDEGLHAALLARDSDSDLEIGAVMDEMWNAMGRPNHSIDFNMIVNGGKKDWCAGDPAKQAALMAVLVKNIRGSNHPKLADKKEAWAGPRPRRIRRTSLRRDGRPRPIQR